MYIPYLRGKQFELLALKEYSVDLGASGAVSPLIEPVKDPDASGGLARCLLSLTDATVRPMVAINPLVGDLVSANPEILSSFLDRVDPTGARIDAAVLVHPDTTPEQVWTSAQQVLVDRKIVLCHVGKNAHLEEIAAGVGDRVRHHIIPSDARPRLYRNAFPDAELAILSDGFPAQARNADYLPVTASEFSDDVLFYEEENFYAFGDHLTVGSGWSEGGFTPRAVAIHWTYQAVVGGPIMIRHFVSTSNGDISNVGRKYLEAVEKLVAFLPDALFVSKAGEVFRESLAAASYPGLGIVKKLSMQNHLEVMMRAMTGA